MTGTTSQVIYNVELSCDVDQLCGSVLSGIEDAIHAMTSVFSQNAVSSGWYIRIVDAFNAFNSLNTTALLWNVRVLWPHCSQFVFNT